MFPLNPKRYIGLIALLALLVLLLSACGSAAATPPASSERLQVVATTNIIADVVRQVGGEQIDLVVLMKPGVDPHSFTPLPSDIAAIHDADVLFVNGLGLEADLDNILENAGGSAAVVVLSENLENLLPIDHAHADEHEQEETHTEEHENEETHAEEHEGEETHTEEHAEAAHHHGEIDPHVWFSIPHVITWTGDIERTLSEMDPRQVELYQQNARAYTEALQALDGWIMEQTAQIAPASRRMVTNHPAFGYYAERYGLEQVGAVYPLNPSAEPSAQDIAALHNLMAELSVKAIFTESTVNPRLAEQVAADSGAKLVRLFTGSLGEPGSGAETYLEMMRYNTENIVSALKGQE